MKKNLHRFRTPLIAVGLLLALFLVTLKPVFIRSGDRVLRVLTHAATVGMALRDAGIRLSPGDRTEPGLDTPAGWGMTVVLITGRPVVVERDGNSYLVDVPYGKGVSASQVLTLAGLVPAAEEMFLCDGMVVESEEVLPVYFSKISLVRPMEVLVEMDGSGQFYSAVGPTVGDALWQAGVRLHAADRVEPAPGTLLTDLPGAPKRITILRAVKLSVTVDGQIKEIFAAGESIGEALARAGLGLAGLDYSLPPEAERLPADGRIRVVRVREETLRGQNQIPFGSDTQPDPDLEIDKQNILQPGAFGILESSTRVRYEDGVEVGRIELGERVLVPPRDRILGYGTKIIFHTLALPGGSIRYWRAVRVYATSYSPCQSAGEPGRCYYGTASGKKVQKGVIAVVRSWYNYMQGQPVYVEGYGYASIEDIGAGIRGRYWIDLGFTDEEYEAFNPQNGWVTMYFLEPVASAILWILP